jgi:hypothetical protein
MDFEGFVLSTMPLAVAAAHEASGEVASVIDKRSFLLAAGREVRSAVIEPPLHVPSDEDEVRVGSGLAAKSAPEAPLSGEALVRHELRATGSRASPVPLAATCRTSLRNAGRDGRNAGFGHWGDPCHVVKQAGDWADVLAKQGRFALVRGKLLSVVNQEPVPLSC